MHTSLSLQKPHADPGTITHGYDSALHNTCLPLVYPSSHQGNSSGLNLGGDEI